MTALGTRRSNHRTEGNGSTFPPSQDPGGPATVSETEQIKAQCRAKGLRLTGQRKLIAEVIIDAHDHPDVGELYRRVVKRDNRISLATVYRTVKRFEAIGLIERHAFQDGRAHYEPTKRVHHDHLIDIASGEVIEFRSEEIERLQAEVAARLGYELVGHRLELYAKRAKAVGR